jgi:hypothetical protein
LIEGSGVSDIRLTGFFPVETDDEFRGLGVILFQSGAEGFLGRKEADVHGENGIAVIGPMGPTLHPNPVPHLRHWP